MNYQEWMNSALNRIRNDVAQGGCFEVKDLFEGHAWKALSRGERVGFGRYFANEVREGRADGITRLERGKDNHSRYIKQ